jgi:Acyltransferase.
MSGPQVYENVYFCRHKLSQMTNENNSMKGESKKDSSATSRQMNTNQDVAKAFKALFPNQSLKFLSEKLSDSDSPEKMLKNSMYPILLQLIDDTSTTITKIGLDQLSKGKGYVFISNHRDIVIDPCILGQTLETDGYEPTGITFGDNLLMAPLIRFVAGRSNKMFTVRRSDSPKEFLQHSMELSEEIREHIVKTGQSLWIAQRNGRTKDGDDRTDQGVLKMLYMSRQDDFVKSIKELNIVPLAISYEFEPCDFLKTQELYLRKRGPYVKSEEEDFNSIVTGLKQFKGGIEYNFCEPFSNDDIQQANENDKNLKFRNLAQLIDKRIHLAFRLWPNNFIAYDQINKVKTYSDKYTPEQEKAFINYMNEGLKALQGEQEELKEIFLMLYANPVINRLAAETQ